MAIIRMLKWMSSACDEKVIFLTLDIPRLDNCCCNNWNRVYHQYMCVIIPTQIIDYQKVILDKEANIIMQIKEVAKWSNRGNL